MKQIISALCVLSPLFYPVHVVASVQALEDASIANTYEQQCELKQRKSTVCQISETHTILRDAGRHAVSIINLSFSEDEQLLLQKAEVIDASGKREPVPAAYIDEKMAPNPAAGFSRQKQISIAFPNLRVGSTVAYQYRYASKVDPLLTQSHVIRHFGPEGARLDKVHITYTSDRPLVWRAFDLDKFTVTASPDRHKVELKLNAPYYQNHVNENGTVVDPPTFELSTSDNLTDHFGNLNQHYNTILEKPLPPKAAQMVESVRSYAPAKRVELLLEFITKHYRYLGDWRASNRGFSPFSLAEIEAHGYGDCKDLSILLVAMLRHAGIQAEPALVFRGAYASRPLIVGLSTFNHLIVRAKVNHQVWWLDPTNLTFIPKETPLDIRNRVVVVLGKDGIARQEKTLERSPKTLMRTKREIALHADGSAQQHIQAIFGGDILLSLASEEHSMGADTTDKDICIANAIHSIDCHVKRAPIGFVLPDQYKIDIQQTDQRAAEVISGYLIYGMLDNFRNSWRSMKNYLEEGHQNDLQAGVGRYEHIFDLRGVTAKKLPKQCHIRSAWVDVDTQAAFTNKGLRFYYRENSKKAWWHHREIVSASFRTLVKEMNACLDGFRQVVIPK